MCLKLKNIFKLFNSFFSAINKTAGRWKYVLIYAEDVLSEDSVYPGMEYVLNCK